MGHVIYDYAIPDPARCIPRAERSPCGPSGPLIPFEPALVRPADVVHRPIARWTPHAGTYGMGGPGFLGFHLDPGWLIVALWGAASWTRLDGRLLVDSFHERHGRPAPWAAEAPDEFGGLFSGDAFVAFEVDRHQLRAALRSRRELVISDSPPLPAFEGNGRPRRFGEDDDLVRAVFLAPSPEICV